MSLVKFENRAVQTGEEEGLPVFEDKIHLIVDRPPNTRVIRVAKDDDKEKYPDAFKLFEKTQTANAETEGGMPLDKWPSLTPADVKNLLARDITSVEQLANLPAKEAKKLTGRLAELPDRAKDFVEIASGAGQSEVMIGELKAEIELLKETIGDLEKEVREKDAAIKAVGAKNGKDNS